MKFFFLSCMVILLIPVGITSWKERGKKRNREQGILDATASYLAFHSHILLEKILKERYQTYCQKEAELLRATSPNQSQNTRQYEFECSRWKLIWLVLFVGSFMGLVGCMGANSDNSAGTEVVRPKFGEGEETLRRRLEYGGDSQEIVLSIPECEPSKEQIWEKLDAAFEYLCEEILNGNESLQRVSKDLNLSAGTISDVDVTWESLSPEWMDDSGHILQEEIPEEGYLAELQVTLCCREEEKTYTFNVHIVPQPKDWNWVQEKIEQIIRQQGDENQEKIVLPEEIDGKELIWKNGTNHTWQSFAWCILVTAVAVYFLKGKQLKEDYQKRGLQLEEDYCHVVTVMSMLLAGGMTIRGAWRQIVLHYEETKGKTPHYVYEEMRITMSEIGNGMSEAYAYHKFGQRCKSYRYMRFAHLLEQGLRQGSTDLAAVLGEESIRALEEHKNEMLKKGEQMQTALLIPMFLMLGVVLVVLIVPAFLSIGMG